MTALILETNTSPIADFIRRRIEELGGEPSHAEIAKGLGYPAEHIVRMFISGEVRIPLQKVPALAKALRADPSHLMTLGLAQYLPASIRCVVTVIEGNEDEVTG